MSSQLKGSETEVVRELMSRKDIEIPCPESISVGQEVNPSNIEPGVKIGPGTRIFGADTMIGAGTEIAGAATIKNCLIGRGCSLHSGEYLDSVLLDRCSTVGWARVRGNCAWEEGTQSAHTVDTKTTVLGYKTTLGSLINFCNVLMLGGTSPRLEVGAEVGSGVINFNFLPIGPTVGALIKPSTVIGSIESPFLSCGDAPVRYDFIGGHSSIIAPVVLGLNCMVAAKTRVNPGIYGDDVLIGGGNLEATVVLDVSKVRILKDIRPKFRILAHQLATAVAFRRWCDLRIEWAESCELDPFAVKLIQAFTEKVDRFIDALEDYGNNISKYLLASDEHSRPEFLKVNQDMVHLWTEDLKLRIRSIRQDYAGYADGTDGMKAALRNVARKVPTDQLQFYEVLEKLPYSSPDVVRARDYFTELTENVIRLAPA